MPKNLLKVAQGVIVRKTLDSTHLRVYFLLLFLLLSCLPPEDGRNTSVRHEGIHILFASLLCWMELLHGKSYSWRKRDDCLCE